MEAYPLSWPAGYSRNSKRSQSRFKQGMDAAQRFLRDELSRLGAKDLIVSTNIPVRNDGLMYSDWMRRKIKDPGVAIYFTYRGKSMSMCCDQYERIWENIYALGRTIEAIRQIARDGVSDFLERSFTGFQALPSSVIELQEPWYTVLGVDQNTNEDDVRKAYHNLARRFHPDNGGSGTEFQKISYAYEIYKRTK